MGLAPAGAVQEEHVGTLGPGYFDALEVFLDEGNGVVHVSCDDLPQLVHPLMAFRLVSANQRIHTEYIHGIVMGFASLRLHALAQIFIVYNMIRTNQPCQIEGL